MKKNFVITVFLVLALVIGYHVLYNRDKMQILHIWSAGGTRYNEFNAKSFSKFEGERKCVSGHIRGLPPVCGADGCLRNLHYDKPQVAVPRKNPLSARPEMIKRFKKIHGVVNITFHGPFAAAVTDMQWSFGVYGSVGEIGVLWGEYSSALAVNTDTKSGERFFAIDIFDRKTRISLEQGNYGMYLKTMKMWNFTLKALFNSANKLHLWHDSSVFVSKTLFLRWKIPSVRLLSIDGGHFRPIVQSDFNKAICIMREGGLIIFDDALLSNVPEVTQAINDFFTLYNDSAFKPLVICKNKLFVTSSTFYPLYMDYIRKNLSKKFKLAEVKDKHFLKGEHRYFECPYLQW